MTRRDLFKFAALAPVAALAAKFKKPEPDVMLPMVACTAMTEAVVTLPRRESDNLSMAEMEMAFRRKWFKESKRPYRPGREF